MLLNVGLLLVILVAIAYSAALLRRIQIDVAQHQRDMRQVEQERHHLDGACNTLRGLIAQVEMELARGMEEMASLRETKEGLDAELIAINEMPKQRLLLFDRGTLAQPRLWEVTMARDTGMSAAASPEGGMEWGAGRTYLIAGISDRDVRYRLEPRFPAAQGYRLVTVERFRRA